MSKFNFVQKLLQFQFRKFGRISHKFLDKNEILVKYLPQNYSCPSILNLKWLRFSPDEYNMWENQVEEYFCKVLNIGDIMLILAQNELKMLNFDSFCHFLLIFIMLKLFQICLHELE